MKKNIIMKMIMDMDTDMDMDMETDMDTDIDMDLDMDQHGDGHQHLASYRQANLEPISTLCPLITALFNCFEDADTDVMLLL
jgi:hypothetical protein